MLLVHNKARQTVARVSFGGGEPPREMEVVGNAPPPPPRPPNWQGPTSVVSCLLDLSTSCVSLQREQPTESHSEAQTSNSTLVSLNC